MLTPAAIWSMVNTIFLIGIIIYIFILHKYLNKQDIVDYIAQIFKVSRTNLEKDLSNFLTDVKTEYSNHQNEIIELLEKQKTEAKELKEVIEKEGQAFMMYLKERVEAQEKILEKTEKRLDTVQRELYKTQNMLSKCQNKLVKHGLAIINEKGRIVYVKNEDS